MPFTSIASFVQCPSCQGAPLTVIAERITCDACQAAYSYADALPCLVAPMAEDAEKRAVMEFWGTGWAKRGQEDASVASAERLLQEMGVNRLLLAIGEAEQVQEMASLNLRGKRVLEVGCGAGTSSVLFALDGAQVVAADLTADAVRITQHKFQLLECSACTAIQADAEHLPFRDGSFDIVFSSGVLHHTPDTQRAVDEVFRVLRPGGTAIVMLYAKWSFQHLVSLLLVRGLLLGGIVRYGWRRWLGHVTEENWHTASPRRNPITKVYSGRAMRALFHRFAIISMRKNGFRWSDIFPGMYRIVPRRMLRIGDTTTTVPSSWEVAMGRWAGFGLVIRAQKPLE